MITTIMPWDDEETRMEKEALQAGKLERLRDEFAMHAPDEPQSWFNPVMTYSLVLPELSEKEKSALHGYNTDDYGRMDFDLGSKLCSERNKITYAYNNEHEKQKYIQWPYAWADEMLKARKVQP